MAKHADKTNPRIEDRFRALRRAGKKALITYVMAGDPDLETSARVVETLVRAGADLIELGVPFSDPLADGPAIQAAGQRALRKGVLCDDVFGLVRTLRRRVDVPLLLMTCYNPVFNFGVRSFMRKANSAGVSGMIIPDLPLEESAEAAAAAARYNLDLVFLATPTTPPDRLRKLGEVSRGFLYYVSRTGVTGERSTLARGLGKDLRALRKLVDCPVAVGFGIRSAGQAKTVARNADGVIIGSALVRIVERYQESPELPARIEEFLQPIAKVLHTRRA